MTSYASSEGVRRSFCGRCGTSLTIFSEEFPEDIYVSVASLDDPSAMPPEIHIWRSHRLDWFDTSDELPRFVCFKSDGEAEKYGPDATTFMGWLVMEKEVTCKLNGERSRDRLIGICYLDGVDIGEAIIRKGLARDCPRYSRGRYAEAEKEAKRTGIHERYELPDYCRPRGLRS